MSKILSLPIMPAKLFLNTECSTKTLAIISSIICKSLSVNTIDALHIMPHNPLKRSQHPWMTTSQLKLLWKMSTSIQGVTFTTTLRMKTLPNNVALFFAKMFDLELLLPYIQCNARGHNMFYDCKHTYFSWLFKTMPCILFARIWLIWIFKSSQHAIRCEANTKLPNFSIFWLDNLFAFGIYWSVVLSYHSI